MLRFIKTQPVFIFGLLELIVGFLIATGVLDAEVGGSLGAIFAFVAASPHLGVVWNAVTPVVRAKEEATEVGAIVAERLEGQTVGAVGTVTDAATSIIKDTVKEVLG